jgi:hypothetical protein
MRLKGVLVAGPELSAEVLREAEQAYWCAYHSGVPEGELPRIVVQAAEPGIRADERRKYEDLLGSVWLYIGWRDVTRQLTTEQKNLFADAVAAELARGGGFDASEAEAAVDRWWIDGGDDRDSR